MQNVLNWKEENGKLEDKQVTIDSHKNELL